MNILEGPDFEKFYNGLPQMFEVWKQLVEVFKNNYSKY